MAARPARIHCLPKERLEDDIRSILKRAEVFQAKHGLKIGKDITIQQFETHRHFSSPSEPALIRSCAYEYGVLFIVEFLRSAGLGLPDLTGKQVVVVGGRNVFMDRGADGKAHGRGRRSASCTADRRHDMTALPEEDRGSRGRRGSSF